jgi:cysteinyl-tRNA synthetase
MGRSMGNMITVLDALKKYSPETLRIWIASTHYRKPLDYNEKDLQVAKAKIDRVVSTLLRIKENIAKTREGASEFSQQISLLEERFFEAMKNDMNTPLALTHFFEIITLVNKQSDRHEVLRADLEKAEQTIRKLGEFFQIIPELKKEEVPAEVLNLIEKREQARKKKDWAQADEIRKQIRKLGYIVEDTAQEPRVKEAEN